MEEDAMVNGTMLDASMMEGIAAKSLRARDAKISWPKKKLDLLKVDFLH